MNLKFLKRLFFLASLFLSVTTFASHVPGYIIDNNLDTVYGEIKIFRTNPNSCALVIRGIDLEQFNYAVSFRKTDETRFTRFEPENLMGFGFLFNSLNYRFDKFKIVSNSIIKSDREHYRFLNLIYSGDISLYCDIVRRPYPVNSFMSDESTIADNVYYLYSDKKGLVRLEKTKEYETIIDLLASFEVEREFLKEISSGYDFMDVIEILYKYSKWKERREKIV